MGGEVSSFSGSVEPLQLQTGTTTTRPGLRQVPGSTTSVATGSGLSTFGAVFPTVFDAIRSAQGITPYTDLSQVQVIRKRRRPWRRPDQNRFKLSVTNTEGNESQNIRLYDGDSLNVGKSPIVLQDQLRKLDNQI